MVAKKNWTDLNTFKSHYEYVNELSITLLLLSLELPNQDKYSEEMALLLEDNYILSMIKFELDQQRNQQ